MKGLSFIASSGKGTWLSEVSQPYWQLSECGFEIDFASPGGGKVGWTSRSDPYLKNSQEPADLVSKGFLSEQMANENNDQNFFMRAIDAGL